MRLYKLIQSIDYVTYPAYKELARIREAIGNHISNTRDAVLASIIGVLFERTPLSAGIICHFKTSQFMNSLSNILGKDNLTLFISIVIAIGFFLMLKALGFICSRWGSNKDTKKKRDIIVTEFYSVAIPQLIEVKGLMEKMTEVASIEDPKKKLLLSQARYEVRELYDLIIRLRIVECNKQGKETEYSRIVQSRISAFAYTSFMIEMLQIIRLIYEGLCCYKKETEDDINDIKAIINGGTPFMVKGAKEKWLEVKNQICSKHTET